MGGVVGSGVERVGEKWSGEGGREVEWRGWEEVEWRGWEEVEWRG